MKKTVTLEIGKLIAFLKQKPDPFCERVYKTRESCIDKTNAMVNNAIIVRTSEVKRSLI